MRTILWKSSKNPTTNPTTFIFSWLKTARLGGDPFISSGSQEIPQHPFDPTTFLKIPQQIPQHFEFSHTKTPPHILPHKPLSNEGVHGTLISRSSDI